MKKLLSTNDRRDLELAYRFAKDKRNANKINILLLIDDGYRHSEIAAILRIDKSTVSRHEKAYQDIGLTDYLTDSFSGGTCKLQPQQLQSLEKHLDAHLCGSTDEVIDYIENKFGVHYTRGGMAYLLKRLGFVFKKPTLIPGKADAEIQHAFIDFYDEIKKSMKSDDKIYFLDGVHPQHNTIVAGGWIRKGEKKELKANTGRQRVNLNGALDPDTLELIIRSDKTLDSRSTIELFKMIEAENPHARKIVLIVDNARYYYNSEVIGYAQDSRQLELVHLPPYSPNLNLIERVWRFMKKKLSNKYHETFKDFQDSIGSFFQEFPKYHDELADLLVEDFQVIGS